MAPMRRSDLPLSCITFLVRAIWYIDLFDVLDRVNERDMILRVRGPTRNRLGGSSAVADLCRAPHSGALATLERSSPSSLLLTSTTDFMCARATGSSVRVSVPCMYIDANPVPELRTHSIATTASAHLRLLSYFSSLVTSPADDNDNGQTEEEEEEEHHPLKPKAGIPKATTTTPDHPALRTRA
ncbi:uncharacterized protein MYCFIDRAFT_206226 [Pseudocercospora fijiensis CIRAD86]|uniref:Uncharacterized protein n=1 Tax=Pseudocercospora fijiensis (strain CIRAD86) TaxID=383855 RepID=N1QCF7_PSEFD|nr:uncharacterized protein MYCFIDRAFT_206226 [Pseudocercospora fijiensis CIRAD86]EME89108.1 hypothetical protein MYCFIDRAFT_206226 [Pseudocercospora fijiensis CIRAD86]